MERKRKTAHRAYDRAAPQQKKPAAKGPAPLPARERPDKAKQRARDKGYETVVGSKNRPEPGTATGRADALAAAPHRARFIPMDIPFLVTVIILLAFGLVMMFSAGYAWAIEAGSATLYIARQVGFALLGFGALLFFAFFDYNRLKKYVPILFLATALLMALVAVIGRVAGGAQRWLFGFQPSELAKISTIFYIAKCSADESENKFLSYSKHKYIRIAQHLYRPLKKGVGPMIFCVGVFGALLVAQSHMSAIVLIALTAAIMVFIGGAKISHLLLTGGVGGGALGALAFLSGKFSHIPARIAVWRDPFIDPRDLGYQTIQSLYAIASGGLFGLGLGQSRQKQLYLPAAHNDYVFSITCEELGLFGAIVLIGLFVALIARGFWIAMHASNRFGFMLGIGVMTLFTLQVSLNLAVVTNTIPVTGISLPFFSYGGTALSVLLAEMGVMLSISKQMKLVKK